MTQHRIHFLSGEDLILTQEEFNELRLLLKISLGTFYNIEVNTRQIVIRADTITYIVSEETENISTVVTPPTPAALRDEEQKSQANQPVTLDEQLANEEVGK